MFFELRFRSIAKFVCSFNNVVRYVIDSGKKGKHKEKARKWQRHGKENAKNKERKRREKRAKK
jgi:hypothetical protein